MTDSQREYLKANPQVSPLDTLPDGDLLVYDDTPTGEWHYPEEGPKILTRGGTLQDIWTHYEYTHEKGDQPWR